MRIHAGQFGSVPSGVRRREPLIVGKALLALGLGPLEHLPQPRFQLLLALLEGRALGRQRLLGIPHTPPYLRVHVRWFKRFTH